MKRIVYLGDEDVAVTFSKAGKTIILQNGEIYTVDPRQTTSLPGPYYTSDATIIKKEED